jgi:hypothetical protein
MKNRFRLGDRRLDMAMPKIPFKDSNGATVKECRRKIPDRRLGNIQVEWIDEGYDLLRVITASDLARLWERATTKQ